MLNGPTHWCGHLWNLLLDSLTVGIHHVTVFMTITYCKSPKGITEIETREHRLPPRLRSALIVIDGKRSSAELRLLIPSQADETIALLLEQGFIEPVASPASVNPAPKAQATPPPAVVPFDSRRRDAVRQLTDQVGPVGEALAMRMERCRNADELRPLLGVAKQMIGSARGNAAGAAYEARFGDL